MRLGCSARVAECAAGASCAGSAGFSLRDPRRSARLPRAHVQEVGDDLRVLQHRVLSQQFVAGAWLGQALDREAGIDQQVQPLAQRAREPRDPERRRGPPSPRVAPTRRSTRSSRRRAARSTGRSRTRTCGRPACADGGGTASRSTGARSRTAGSRRVAARGAPRRAPAPGRGASMKLMKPTTKSNDAAVERQGRRAGDAVVDAERSSALGLLRVAHEDAGDVDGRHPRATSSEQARVVAVAAADVEPGESADVRQQVEERRRVQAVAIDVVARPRQLRPGLGVLVPEFTDFTIVHR